MGNNKMKMSKIAELSEHMRLNYPISKMSLAKRKKVHGFGINDSDYVTHPIINGKQFTCTAYDTWVGILRRAFSAKLHNNRPTYKNVSVCEEWLTFSNFRKWFIKNHVDDYHLDKDILILNNKTYSPDVCIYVPSWLNSFITDSHSARGKYKIGVSYHKHVKKFQAQCRDPRIDGRVSLGYFENEDGAHHAWLNKKLEITSELKYELDTIDPRIYQGVVDVIKNLI